MVQRTTGMNTQNLVPTFIREQFALQQFSGHFDCVSLFVDISGFTRVTETVMQQGDVGAELLADAMQAIFEPLVGSVYEHGGFITGFAGDAFTALFLGNDLDTYRRALAASLYIQAHMENHAVWETPYGVFSFAVKQGMADGDVEWGILQPEQDESLQSESTLKNHYFFSGSAIDDCSAAEHRARGGEIIISQSVQAMLQDLTQIEHVDGAFFRLLQVHAKEQAQKRMIGRVPPPHSSEISSQQSNDPFVPSEIRQQTTHGEFRPVVTLFLNLRNVYTMQTLTDFVQSIFHLQAQYSGYLNTIDFGDKGCTLLLFWGMPTSFENNISRALDFVLALKRTYPDSFRAGITYRTMYAGFVGASIRQEYSCYGRGGEFGGTTDGSCTVGGCLA